MSLDRLLPSLRCPLNGDPLERSGDTLVSMSGEVYPIVHGVPVLLIEPNNPTHWAVEASYKAARSNPGDQYQLDTVPLSNSQRRQILQAFAADEIGPVDPVIRGVVARAGGYMYADLVDTLREIPIPELRMSPGSGTLLDIGCNWGRWSIAAAKMGYAAVGLDPSLGAVLAARRLAEAMGLSIDFVVADALRLPFCAETFDHVFSYSVLQHFSRANAESALRECARVSKQDATLLVQMPNMFGLRCLQHQARRRFRAARRFEVRYYSPGRLVQMFTATFGPSQLSVDGYFGLGIQPADRRLLSGAKRWIIDASELLRAAAKAFPPLLYLADSLYVSSRRGA